VPTARGGVQLEWHERGRDLEVEVRELGVYTVYTCRGDEDEEFSVSDDVSRIRDLAHAFSR